jgi:hypothetical protein
MTEHHLWRSYASSNNLRWKRTRLIRRCNARILLLKARKVGIFRSIHTVPQRERFPAKRASQFGLRLRQFNSSGFSSNNISESTANPGARNQNRTRKSRNTDHILSGECRHIVCTQCCTCSFCANPSGHLRAREVLIPPGAMREVVAINPRCAFS